MRNSTQANHISLDPLGFYMVHIAAGTLYSFVCVGHMWIENGPGTGLEGKQMCYVANKWTARFNETRKIFSENYKMKQLDNSCKKYGDTTVSCKYNVRVEKSLNRTNITCFWKENPRFLHFHVHGISCM